MLAASKALPLSVVETSRNARQLTATRYLRAFLHPFARAQSARLSRTVSRASAYVASITWAGRAGIMARQAVALYVRGSANGYILVAIPPINTRGRVKGRIGGDALSSLEGDVA